MIRGERYMDFMKAVNAMSGEQSVEDSEDVQDLNKILADARSCVKNTTPLIDLSKYNYKSIQDYSVQSLDEYTVKNDIKNELSKISERMASIYVESFYEKILPAEDIIQNIILDDFTAVAEITRADIHYRDRLLHMRFVFPDEVNFGAVMKIRSRSSKDVERSTFDSSLNGIKFSIVRLKYTINDEIYIEYFVRV